MKNSTVKRKLYAIRIKPELSKKLKIVAATREKKQYELLEELIENLKIN